MPADPSPAGRCLVGALGMILAAAIACLAVVGPPVARLAHSGPRVVAAVRAGYPELCSEWRDKLEAVPSAASWYTSWDVRCESGYAPGAYPLMTVNVITCQWREPLDLSLDWQRVWARLTAASQPLRRCP